MKGFNQFKSKGKYLAKKIDIDGIIFASKKESQRYIVLRDMVKNGEIFELELQKTFNLIPPQKEPDTIGVKGGVKKGKTIERAVDYIADFVYKDKNGNTIVEDVKGFKMSTAYAVFAIKRKLMLYRYGIKVEEI